MKNILGVDSLIFLGIFGFSGLGLLSFVTSVKSPSLVKITDSVQPTAKPPVQIKDYIFSSEIGFETSFGDPKSNNYHYDIPDTDTGWIVCSMLGNIKAGRGASCSWAFTNPRPGDPQNPPRTRGITYYLSAPASNNPIDRWTSNIYVDNVGIHAISSNATLQDRYNHGCDLKAPIIP